MKSNFFIFIVFLFIIGCQNSEKKYANCSSNDAQELVRKIISEQTDKKISNVRYESGEFVFDKANIRASLEQIQFFLESIRTTKEDPNSTKKFCNANLKVTVPANLLSDADTARDTERKIKISQYARELEIENNINVFIKKNIEYSVQPTDDGKEIYVEIESVTWVNLLNEIVSSGLWKPILDVQKLMSFKKMNQPKKNKNRKLKN